MKVQQQLISKQNEIQIQNLKLCYDTLVRVLAFGEKYALSKNVKFEAYNLSSDTSDDLLILFVREIEIFRLYYQDYVEKYGKFDFPNNLPKKEMLKEIINWEIYVPQENRKYYTCLYNLVNGNYNFSLNNEINLLKQKKKIGFKENYLQNINNFPKVQLVINQYNNCYINLSKNMNVNDNEDFDEMK